MTLESTYQRFLRLTGNPEVAALAAATLAIATSNSNVRRGHKHRDNVVDPLDALVDWIKSKGGRTTVREASRGLQAFKNTDKVRAALHELANKNVGYWDEPRQNPVGGKPVVAFILGPKL